MAKRGICLCFAMSPIVCLSNHITVDVYDDCMMLYCVYMIIIRIWICDTQNKLAFLSKIYTSIYAFFWVFKKRLRGETCAELTHIYSDTLMSAGTRARYLMGDNLWFGFDVFTIVYALRVSVSLTVFVLSVHDFAQNGEIIRSFARSVNCKHSWPRYVLIWTVKAAR